MANTRVALIGSGRDVYREYLLRQIGQAGFRIVLLDDREAGWREKYIDYHVRTPFSSDEMWLGLDGPEAPPVAGVFTWEEQSVVIAAQLAQRCGTPGPSVESVELTRDKGAMRRAWSLAGVPSPQSIPVSSAEEALAAFRLLESSNVIVKPRSLAASAGVSFASTPSEVINAFKFASEARLTRYSERNYPHPVLIEEYVDGPEFSIEGAVFDRQFYPLAVTRKTTGPLPRFEETQHICGPVEENHSELVSLAKAAVDALELSECVVHAEIKCSTAGPRMIEVAARLGGDLIPYLVEIATGHHMGVIACQIACGVPSFIKSPVTQETQYAGIRFIYCTESGILEKVAMPSGAGIECVQTAVPGQRYSSLEQAGTSDRLGYMVVSGSSPEQVKQRLDDLESEVVVAIQR